MFIARDNSFSTDCDLLVDVSLFQSFILNRFIAISSTEEEKEICAEELKAYKVFDL